MDIISYLLGMEAGGGDTPTGTINITENGTKDVTNYATADVNVQPDLESKEITITSNTTTNVTPTTGKDGLSQVSVITNVQPNLETKSVTITENTTTTITPTTGKDGLSSVEVITNVSGGGDDWSDIGYSSMPKTYKSSYDYTKEVYDNWDAQNPTNKIGSSNLLEICPNVDVSNMTDYINNLFKSYTKLKEVPALNVNVNYANYLQEMFYNCSSLIYVDFSNFTVNQNVNQSIYGMFSGCSSLKNVDISYLSSSNLKNCSEAFFNCNSLSTITFGNNFNTSNVTTMSKMFINCSSLKNIDLSMFNTNNTTAFDQMFSGCSNLETIDFGNNFKFTSATGTGASIYRIFYNCKKLDNNTLNQILHICTTIGSGYTGAKTLAQLGITSSFTNFANIPNLSNYQDFLDAGWTIS